MWQHDQDPVGRAGGHELLSVAALPVLDHRYQRSVGKTRD